MERLFDQSTLQCNSGTVYTNVDFISSISQICVSKQKLRPIQEQKKNGLIWFKRLCKVSLVSLKLMKYYYIIIYDTLRINIILNLIAMDLVGSRWDLGRCKTCWLGLLCAVLNMLVWRTIRQKVMALVYFQEPYTLKNIFEIYSTCSGSAISYIFREIC